MELPVEIWFKIFLYLNSVDLGAFLIAFPSYTNVVCSHYFCKKYLKRFKPIRVCRTLNSFRTQRYKDKFQPLTLWNGWCDTRRFLPSGHCVACLTTPYLLAYSPFQSGCYCIDHRRLWYNLRDVVLWTHDIFQDLSPGWVWPACGVPLFEPDKAEFKNEQS
ncbi:RH3 [Bovine adenovirus 7]|uniref:RH3 protein n=1 Tax=Bovine adenovirus 7 TaxID=10511 RepID=A0A7R7FRR2_ADEB7|nr:RH3 [Bovine adenovirus 7]URN46045.1 RH3 [Bovine adenovirus 7]BCO10945.1 RH3 [Bovine adenovirus 7]BCS90536.1 RH3 [Bovine adenovirus 7]